jgi:hypothetical protein
MPSSHLTIICKRATAVSVPKSAESSGKKFQVQLLITDLDAKIFKCCVDTQ